MPGELVVIAALASGTAGQGRVLRIDSRSGERG